MAGLAVYMAGLAEAGPTRSGHRDPGDHRRGPGQRHRRRQCPLQRLAVPPDPRPRRARGAAVPGRGGGRGAGLCRNRCRYPHHSAGVDPALPSPVERMRGAVRDARSGLGIGTRGRGSEATAAPIWGISAEEYLERCEPWPLDPAGELLLGVKLESPEGIANCEEILAVPGLGFAELGPGDLGLALGYTAVPRDPYPPEMAEARRRVFAACRKNRVAFLETCSPETIAAEARRGGAGGRRPPRGHRDHRPRPPAPHDAGVTRRSTRPIGSEVFVGGGRPRSSHGG